MPYLQFRPIISNLDHSVTMAGLFLQFYYLKILNNLTILFHNHIRGLQITLTQEWQKKKKNSN